MTGRVTPPMPYAGGKQRMAAWIVGTFPPHRHYVEPHAGGLSVLLAKPPSPVETVSDIDGDLMTFWRVLRDQPDELERALALTPHSRAEKEAAYDLPAGLDDAERARRVWVQLTQSRSARRTRSGWRFVHGTNMALTKYLAGYVARVAPAAERLRNVSLDNRPALDLIACYDRPGTLFYLDPPYLGATRYGAQYAHEMVGDDEHAELLARVRSCVGMVAISGYTHPLYDQALAGWMRHTRAAVNVRGEARTEVLWTNY